MSGDPRGKFQKKIFFPNYAFNIGKSCKISSRKGHYFRSYQPKNHTEGMENTPSPLPPPPPSAFRVKATAILMKKSISKKDMQLYFHLQRCPFIRSRWQSTSDEDVSIEVKSLFSSKGDKIIIKFPLG